MGPSPSETQSSAGGPGGPIGTAIPRLAPPSVHRLEHKVDDIVLEGYLKLAYRSRSSRRCPGGSGNIPASFHPRFDVVPRFPETERQITLGPMTATHSDMPSPSRDVNLPAVPGPGWVRAASHDRGPS